jgi:hypothetical protein
MNYSDIDWALLRTQKEWLLGHRGEPAAEGLVNLLDSLQDRAVYDGEPYHAVFGDYEWNYGPPPHVGWWNACREGVLEPNVWRWWNGVRWSIATTSEYPRRATPLAVVLFTARTHSTLPNPLIVWTHRWPANARVPRIDPGSPS